MRDSKKVGQKESSELGQWLWSTERQAVFCTVAADVAPEVPGEQSSGGHDRLQHSVLLHLVLSGFPCRPSPWELLPGWLSP